MSCINTERVCFQFIRINLHVKSVTKQHILWVFDSSETLFLFSFMRKIPQNMLISSKTVLNAERQVGRVRYLT